MTKHRASTGHHHSLEAAVERTATHGVVQFLMTKAYSSSLLSECICLLCMTHYKTASVLKERSRTPRCSVPEDPTVKCVGHLSKTHINKWAKVPMWGSLKWEGLLRTSRYTKGCLRGYNCDFCNYFIYQLVPWDNPSIYSSVWGTFGKMPIDKWVLKMLMYLWVILDEKVKMISAIITVSLVQRRGLQSNEEESIREVGAL